MCVFSVLLPASMESVIAIPILEHSLRRSVLVEAHSAAPAGCAGGRAAVDLVPELGRMRAEHYCAHGNAEAAANWVEATLPVAPLVHILVHVRVAASMEPATVAQKAADEGEEDGEQNGHDQSHDEQRVINLEWEAARVVDGRGVALGPARLMVRRIPVNQRLDHILVVSLATVVAMVVSFVTNTAGNSAGQFHSGGQPRAQNFGTGWHWQQGEQEKQNKWK